MKKTLLIGLLSFTSISAFAVDDCLRYMSNTRNAEIIMKKQCDLVLEDTGKNKVHSIEVCFTKIKNQFKNKISYGLVADIQKQTGRVRSDVMIVNTINAKEDVKNIAIDITTMSPEQFFKRTRSQIKYNKESNTLSIVEDQGIVSLKNTYKLKLQCN